VASGSAAGWPSLHSPPATEFSAEILPAVVVFEFTGGTTCRPERQARFQFVPGMVGETTVGKDAEHRPRKNEREQSAISPTGEQADEGRDEQQEPGQGDEVRGGGLLGFAGVLL